ncbi:hypothetical protein [Comamonas terrae]|uniref:Uncharacterized protein n=1 Tax=Comamonas terrae TaxID=673548 RepID=A0ABW5UKW0_9BURK|nr:hypothetical protein [Comamonas terrae]
MSDLQPHSRVKFDPTVNLGHVLTFIGFMTAGITAYGTLDKRVSLIESQAAIASSHVRDQDSRLKETLSDIRADVKDLQRTVNNMSRTVGTRSAP